MKAKKTVFTPDFALPRSLNTISLPGGAAERRRNLFVAPHFAFPQWPSLVRASLSPGFDLHVPMIGELSCGCMRRHTSPSTVLDAPPELWDSRRTSVTPLLDLAGDITQNDALPFASWPAWSVGV